VSGRRTVLIVDDDPGTLYVLASGLSNVLDMFDVVTAANGREAIELLEERPIDVLVTDLAMPVMDGFALIAYLTNQRSTLPVVVLSGMAPHSMDQRLEGYGGLRVLRKPAGYQELARCVLEEIERVDLGQVEGIPLASVLQLVEAERRSCSVVVTSGKRRGRLQFESGRLVNAFSDDFGAEGEAAAYDILSWTNTAIGFEQLPINVRKLIRTPMQLMLIELAVVQDEGRGTGDRAVVQDTAALGPTDPPGPSVEGGADGEDAFATGDAADGAGVADPVRPRPPGDTAAGAASTDPAAGATRRWANAVDALAEVGAAPGPAESAPGGFQADPLAAPDATSSVPATHANGTNATPLGGTEATERATTGNGEAMRSDATDDGTLPIHPGPTPAEPAAAVPAPGAAEDRITSDGVASDHVASDHVADMVAAVERLAQRARAADEALAAVAAEVDAFRAAQRRFDETEARRERRRRELEAFRDDVARLAREILGRVDGMFDAMAGSDAAPDASVKTPT
jgi:CheY-like chemotaxis protein